MKILSMLCLVFLVTSAAGPALAQCPIAGEYTAADSLLNGRYSEAWCGAGGEPLIPGRPGNTGNAMSFNGSVLGGQWKLWGMHIDGNGAVEVGSNLDTNGTGWIEYETNYLGGQFWLSKDYLWGDGVNDLTGNVTAFNVRTRVTLVLGNVVGATSNIYMTGAFPDCPNCVLEYTFGNAMLVWRSDWSQPEPSPYPAFLCGAASGEYSDVCCMTIKIHCGVGVEESSWGAIKEIYR
jgi:hypothetical protein